MKRGLFLFGILAFGALPALAQSSEFGVLIGGSKRDTGKADRASGDLTNTGFKWSNRVKEVYYSLEVEPQAWFKLKGGEIDGSTSFQVNDAGGQVRHDYNTGGKVQYIEGIGEYRFSEPFGSTGLFLGVGLFRQQHPSESSESNYGFVGGVNGDFPITRRIGFVAEAAYHQIPFHYTGRYLSLAGGLRFRY